ncbi:uncharacterized protein A4U43_C08F23830 [Asparagus officinalis]|uniref:serine/threonine-protein kinase fray2-like isoform X2 n=1 Tax=Asparagus officinalis TaxID=4686 RepID=UPI00098E8727|nr:serine/threonine-protein kinase fray2-like isoform X2 [Asparagus officinalis]ONK60896.1 uncharacterized protein A4U43_C08F23830 [Asparagus officinalis]
MGSSEPVLVPEWYRAGKGGKAPNASSARNRLLLIPVEQDSKRSLSREGDFGRRGRMENVDSRARARDGDRDGGRDQDRGGDRNRERRNSSGFNVEGSVIQASSRSSRQRKRLVPVVPSLPKSSSSNSSENSKSRGAPRSGDFSGPHKNSQKSLSQLTVVNNALHVSAAKSDILKESQFGNLQVLSRERTGPISIAVQDAGLRSSVNSNLKAEAKDTSSSSIEKRFTSKAQNRNAFFNSLRKKTSVNHSNASAVPEPSCCDTTEKPLSLEMHATICGSVINEEEKNTDESVVSSGDSVDATYVFESQSPEDNGENERSLCGSNCNCDTVVDPDEQEKAFLLSLGWKEDAEEEALTEEEIAAFIKQYPQFSKRF